MTKSSEVAACRLAVLDAIKPWIHPTSASGDFPMVLSVLAEMLPLVAAGAAFQHHDELRNQIAFIENVRQQLDADYARIAMSHLAGMNAAFKERQTSDD